MLTILGQKLLLLLLPLASSCITVVGLRADTRDIPKISLAMVMALSTRPPRAFHSEKTRLKAAAKALNYKALTAENCGELWQSLLDNQDFVLTTHTDWETQQAPNIDIVYWYSGGAISDPNTYCYFNYVSDDRRLGSENWELKYYPLDGRTVVGRSSLSAP
jgi:hypothetical protein